MPWSYNVLLHSRTSQLKKEKRSCAQFGDIALSNLNTTKGNHFLFTIPKKHINPYNPLHLQSHHPHSYSERHHQSPYYHTGLLTTFLLPEKAETVSQTVIAITLVRAFTKHYLSVWVELPLQAVNNYIKLYYSGLRTSSLFHVASYNVWARSRRKTSVSSEWMTHMALACRTLRELYAYQPLSDFTRAQEQARIWPVWLVASTDLRSSRTWSDCQACLWMLLSCILTGGV